MKFNLISWLHKNDSREKILNYGLKTFRDKYLNADITIRKLKRRYPNLPVKIIETYLQECEKANTYGVDYIEIAAAKGIKPKALFNDKKIRLQFNTLMTEQFPWIDSFNLSSIYNWTCHGLLFDD